MGQLLSLASTIFSGRGDADAHVVDEKINSTSQKNEVDEMKQHEEIDMMLKTQNTDMWNLIHFIQHQGQEIWDIKKQMATLLRHQQKMNYSLISKQLEIDLGFHQSYDKMLLTIQTSLQNGAFSLPRVIEHSQSLTSAQYHVDLENFIQLISSSIGTSSSIGNMIVTVLDKLKNIHFFPSSDETNDNNNNNGNQSFSIINIIEISKMNKNGIVLFECTRLNTVLKNEKNEIVAFGSDADRVLVNTYYTRGTVALCDLFPDQAQLTEVIAALNEPAE